MTTKDAIIYESLKLFSDNGFDGVSTRMIARAVGASDAVIYKHFKNKQEILDTIIEKCRQRFLDRRGEVKIQQMDWNRVEELCLEMFHFQTRDEWIVLFRKLLIVEQFKDPRMAALYQTIFIDSAIDGMTVMFAELIRLGYMKPGNPKVYAMELYAPFFLYHTVSAGEQDLEQDLKEHVTYFRNNVKTPKCEE